MKSANLILVVMAIIIILFISKPSTQSGLSPNGVNLEGCEEVRQSNLATGQFNCYTDCVYVTDEIANCLYDCTQINWQPDIIKYRAYLDTSECNQLTEPGLCWYNCLGGSNGGGECNTEADTNCDGAVSRVELGAHIQQWMAGNIDRQSLGNAIQAWVSQ